MAEAGFLLSTSDPAAAACFADAHPPLRPAQAVVAAERCYFCYDAPCIAACPTEIDIPNFIRGIATGNLAGAARTILGANIFGGACARVCPTEILCERACVRTEESGEPVAIGALQRVATDWQFSRGQIFVRAPETGQSVAVVGAGPAGFSAAHALALLGHEVTVYEARAKPGGLNEYGIAAYKMADGFAAREVAYILELGGITVRHGQALGRDFDLASLRAAHDAVFLGLGQQAVNRMGIPGEDLPGVRDAVAFIAELRQGAAPPPGRRVVVIGGGNTAVDAAVQAKFLGAAEVTMLYRGDGSRMSATVAEREWAQTNGVAIAFHTVPLRIERDGGALRVVTADKVYEAELVLKAVGQRFSGLDGLALDGGRIAVDAAGATSLPGVFAGGDCVAGPDLTVQAVADGKRAAQAMHAYLSSGRG